MYRFYHSCINWPGNVNNLNDMIDSSNSITRKTFLKYIDRKELQEIESQLGYSNHPKKGLTMASDWSVTYHKSKLKNKRVYYFCYSAIEFVFTNK